MDGMIGVPEVVFALQGATGRQDVDETEVRTWLQLISTDPSGEIDIYDLAQILASYEGAGDNTAKAKRKQLEAVFKQIDEANTGSLAPDRIQVLGARAGVKFSTAEAQELLTACDVDGSGAVDKVDFLKVMQGAWDQPHELWQDLALEKRAKLAARQAEIDRLQAQVNETPEGEEPDPDVVKQLEALTKEAEIEDLTEALKRMPEGSDERAQGEARLEELTKEPEPEPEPAAEE